MRVTNTLSQIPLKLLLAGLFLLSLGWHPVQANESTPSGCESVFAATTRGGSEFSIGGGGCNFLGGGGTDKVKVVRVVDGDTIVLEGGRRVRYLGIDTPEIGDDPEPYGVEATEANRRLVEGRTVFLAKDESDKDRFGRLLRFVYADGILVNAELVREGYARAKVYLPDTKHADCFAALQQEAAEEQRGMWATE